MPELPEVETVRCGIEPHLRGQTIDTLVVRTWKLRYPVSRRVPGQVAGCTIDGVRRRGKYLLIDCGEGHLLWHLGMSGSLRVLTDAPEPSAHDHIDLCLTNGTVLRFRDPRKFGSLNWVRGNPMRHKLLAELGPEPLTADFDGDYLHACAQTRTSAVKHFLMDSKVVVGVGNIYASEALFAAGIIPTRAANRVSLERYHRLAQTVQTVLAQAIGAGGTTLRDFTEADGSPGYFAQQLQVYGRTDEPCLQCATPIRVCTIGQRSSFYCPRCQR